MATWPTDLPQLPLMAYRRQDHPSAIISGETDSGDMRRRRRFTSNVKVLTVSLRMTEWQVALLDKFYDVTLGKVLEFDWIDPVGNAAATCWFDTAPDYICIAGGQPTDLSEIDDITQQPAPNRLAKYEVNFQLRVRINA